MIKKENLEKTSAWPFVEAKKLLEREKIFHRKKR
jgi:lysyl-tRNA synthetase class 1